MNLYRVPAGTSYSGFGDKVECLKDERTGGVVCVIGTMFGEKKIHFPSPINIETLREVSRFLLNEHEYAPSAQGKNLRYG